MSFKRVLRTFLKLYGEIIHYKNRHVNIFYVIIRFKCLQSSNKIDIMQPLTFGDMAQLVERRARHFIAQHGVLCVPKRDKRAQSAMCER